MKETSPTPGQIEAGKDFLRRLAGNHTIDFGEIPEHCEVLLSALTQSQEELARETAHCRELSQEVEGVRENWRRMSEAKDAELAAEVQRHEFTCTKWFRERKEMVDQLVSLRSNLVAQDAAYAQGVEAAEARAVRRIGELELDREITLAQSRQHFDDYLAEKSRAEAAEKALAEKAETLKNIKASWLKDREAAQSALAEAKAEAERWRGEFQKETAERSKVIEEYANFRKQAALDVEAAYGSAAEAIRYKSAAESRASALREALERLQRMYHGCNEGCGEIAERVCRQALAPAAEAGPEEKK